MSDGILGRKVGMTQIFTEDGKCVPVTVIKAGPCVVVREKTVKADGYHAIQLGFEEITKPNRIRKPIAGYCKKNNVAVVRVLREITSDNAEVYKAGVTVTAEQIFNVGDSVHVVGTSKGKGFAGGVKRWHFKGGPATHGSHFHRAPGSVGASSYPSRVFRGQRLPGHMGDDRVTVRNLTVMDVPKGKDIILVKGAVPGCKGSLVIVKKAS